MEKLEKATRKITFLSTRGFCGEGSRVNEFCIITANITSFNTVNFQWLRFQDYKVEFSEMFSKLPIIRNFVDLTEFQQQYDFALKQIRTSDEVDVWSYKSTIAMMNNDLRRRHKKSKLVRQDFLPADNANIIEWTSELPRRLHGENCNLSSLCKYYKLDANKIMDITKQLLDNEEYTDVPCSMVLVKCVIQMFVRLMQLGYTFEELEAALEEASWRYYEEEERLDEIYVNLVPERG